MCIRDSYRPEYATKYLSIESSELSLENSDLRKAVRFYALIRNHANFRVAYPVVALVLLDSQKQDLARKLIFPVDYLKEDTGVGIKPHPEIKIDLLMEIGGIVASTYRIELL